MLDKKLQNIHVFGTKHHDITHTGALLEQFKEDFANYNICYFKDDLLEDKLNLTNGADVILCHSQDKLNEKTMEELAKNGVKVVILMDRNYENVNIASAKKHNIQVAYCPHYTPEAIAEHAMALLMTINRHIHKSYNRVREDNFELDGLLGIDLHGKTMGLLGLGKVGRAFARICIGFGMKVLAWDKVVKNDEKLAVEFVSFDELLSKSDVVSIHLALNEETKYIINEKTIAKMKKNAFLINTAAGSLINSEDLLKALLEGKFSGVGLDVYEDKYQVFALNLEGQILQDTTLARLLTIPKVLITCRQGWYTKENLVLLLETLIRNIKSYNETGKIIDFIY